MNEEHFNNTLREFLRREPFQPFVIELKDERRVFVDFPSVVFSNGFAGFLGESEFTSFRCEEVARIVQAAAEAKP